MIMNERYLRHIQLSQVGFAGQEKIRKSKLLVVGAGGLGCPALQYLVAAGVGTIGIMDSDLISVSNLHRQIIFNEEDLGENKALRAKKHLQRLNSEVKINAFSFDLTHENAKKYFDDYDIVLDGTDNFYTRYLISDQCILSNKVMIYGAIHKFEGQISVFNYQNGPSYRCLFPISPKIGEIQNCTELGVLGIVPGIVGIYQAAEAVKVILGLGNVLSGKLLCLNLLNHQNTILKFKKNKSEVEKIKKGGKIIPIDNKDCYINYEISLSQLSNEEKIKWIDVRKRDELPRIRHLNSLTETVSIESLIGTKEKIIVFCQTGIRSKEFVKEMIKKGIENCFFLKEGAEKLDKWGLNKLNDKKHNEK